jgi:hypothetical protein
MIIVILVRKDLNQEEQVIVAGRWQEIGVDRRRARDDKGIWNGQRYSQIIVPLAG